MKTFKYIVFLAVVSLLIACSDEDDNSPNEIQNNGSGLTLVNQASIGSMGDEFGIDIIDTPNGFIVCGVTVNDQPYLVSIDNNLQFLWDITLGNSNIGGLETIIKVSDGNYVAAGFIEVIPEDFNLDLFLVKFDEFGNTIWDKNLGYSYVTDTTVDLVEAPNGDLIIAGSKITEPLPLNIFDYETDILLARLDAEGNSIWSNTYGDSENETLSSILMENNGDILIGGTYSFEDPEQNSGNITLSENDIIIYRVDSNGNLQLQKTFGSSDGDGSARLYRLDNGQIAVLSASSGEDGDISGVNNGERDVWLFTLNNALDITSQISVGGSGSDLALKLIQNDNGSIYLVGSTSSNENAEVMSFADTNRWIVKLSSSLSVIDELSLGGTNFDDASGTVLKDGRLIIVGSTNSTDGDVLLNNGAWDIWITIVDDI